MSNKVIKGAIFGGLTYFIWMNISWMAIGWHNAYMESFTDESAVGETLKSMATQPGLYAIPDPLKCKGPDDMAQKMSAGPFAYIMLRPAGKPMNMGMMMLLGFLASCLWSGIATAMLLKTSGLSLISKVGFVKAAGLLGTVSVYFAQWNWWGFTGMYVLINLLDQGIAWGLVGLVIAKFVAKEPS